MSTGCLGSRDLGKRAENFATSTLQPGYQDEHDSGMHSDGPDGIVAVSVTALPAVFSTS